MLLSKGNELFNSCRMTILVTFFYLMQTVESSVIYSQSPEEILDRTIRLDVNNLASFRATLTMILCMQTFKKLSTGFINAEN